MITPNSLTNVERGTVVQFTAKPNENCWFNSITVVGGTTYTNINSEFTFSVTVNSDVTINSACECTPKYTVTVQPCAEGGQFTPSAPQVVLRGTLVSYSFTQPSDIDCSVTSIKVNNIPYPATSPISF